MRVSKKATTVNIETPLNTLIKMSPGVITTHVLQLTFLRGQSFLYRSRRNVASDRCKISISNANNSEPAFTNQSPNSLNKKVVPDPHPVSPALVAFLEVVALISSESGMVGCYPMIRG